jgi:hypothetical protein
MKLLSVLASWRVKLKITDFYEKHSDSQQKSIKTIVDSWVAQHRAEDFLNIMVAPGVILGDVIMDGRMLDYVSSDALEGFKELMEEDADTLKEVKAIIAEKLVNGDKSVEGLINKIQGQVGENLFQQAVGDHATLATDGSQEGWDVAINHGDYNQYVQVKIYNDPRSAINEMKDLNLKLQGDHGISGVVNDESVSSIDFAVNSDVFEEVQQMALDEGLPNTILNVGATRDEIRTGLLDAVDFVKEGELPSFIQEVLGGAATVVAINCLIQGISYWRGAKEKSQATEDAIYNSLVSTGGVAGAYAVDAVLLAELEVVAGVLAGPIGMAVAFGTASYFRTVLNRFANRRYLVTSLDNGNKELHKLCLQFAA